MFSAMKTSPKSRNSFAGTKRLGHALVSTAIATTFLSVVLLAINGAIPLLTGLRGLLLFAYINAACLLFLFPHQLEYLLNGDSLFTENSEQLEEDTMIQDSLD